MYMKRFPLVLVVVAIVVVMALPAMAQKETAATTDNAQKAATGNPHPVSPPRSASGQASPGETRVGQPQSGPQTEERSQAQGAEAMDPNDPLFGVPPLPEGQVSLVGGTVQKMDRLRNRVTVKTFGDGGKKMTVAFDERTHIYRDGVETTERGIRQGDRVYVDTMLDGPRLFARNIRVVTSLKPTDAQGQILAYDPGRGLMTVRDNLSSTTVTFHVNKDTVVKGGSRQGAIELVPGSLVTVHFSPDKRYRDVAREVEVMAAPGTSVTFAGKVRYLDMSRGTIAVENLTDNKTYELQFARGVVHSDVTVGSDVTVAAVFTGQGYKAQTVAVNQAAKE
jgi:Domain of unknown function (DUF5666)